MPVSATRCGQPCFIWLGVESLTVGVESCEEPVPIGDARSWKVLAGHRWVGLRNMPKIYFH